MSIKFISENYYLISIIIITIAFGIFLFCYERKKPQAGEMVILAIMSAIAVASRAVFAMLPFFKPMMGIVMITGMAFGAGAGCLTGVVSGFVSNYIFGQGPWTPWQMLAYGIGGALAGILAKRKMMSEEKKWQTAVLGYGIIQLVVGPILDTYSIFMMGQAISKAFIFPIYAAGLVPNFIHGAATFLTLFLLGKPMMEKLVRIKIKYGLMREEEDEI